MRSVTVTAEEIRQFNDRWPCSNIPEQDIIFTFDANGDMVDIESAIDSALFDGAALLALSNVAVAKLFGSRYV